MEWIKRILGITELVKEQIKTNELLNDILIQTKRSADLKEKYNDAYHIK